MSVTGFILVLFLAQPSTQTPFATVSGFSSAAQCDVAGKHWQAAARTYAGVFSARYFCFPSSVN